MIQQTQTVNEVVDHLAAKLSVPASHLWAVLVRQVRVDVVQNTLAVLFFCAVIAVLMGMRPRARKYVEAHKSDLPALGACYVVSAAAFGIMLGILGGVVGRLMNPEYYALQDILEQLRK